MEDEKEQLKDNLQSLYNDYGNVGIGIELLEEEIYKEDCDVEKVEKLVEDIDGWVESIDKGLGNFEEAIANMKKIKILNNLEKEEEE